MARSCRGQSRQLANLKILLLGLLLATLSSYANGNSLRTPRSNRRSWHTHSQIKRGGLTPGACFWSRVPLTKP